MNSPTNHQSTGDFEDSLEAALRKLPKAQLGRAAWHLRHEGAARQGQPAGRSPANRGEQRKLAERSSSRGN